jgi:hypothetical protein
VRLPWSNGGAAGAGVRARRYIAHPIATLSRSYLMPVSTSFVDYVREQLAGLGG